MGKLCNPRRLMVIPREHFLNMKLEGRSLIAGKPGGGAGKGFTAVNPVTGVALPVTFLSADAAGVHAAATAASEAFVAYSRWTGVQRAAFLNRIAELLEANGALIAERGGQETALPEARLQGELARTCFQLRMYGQAAASGLCVGARIDHAEPQRKPLSKPDLRSLLVPIGPVVVFGASNFPLAYSVAGGDTASAFAAGCPVIVKAHPAHPGTAEIIGQLVTQAAHQVGAPPGVFSLLFDEGHEVGKLLVEHPLVRGVGFTGSQRGGRALMKLAAGRQVPIPVYAEMGSINPVFLLGSALRRQPEEIASGLHASITLGVGQFCTNPGLVVVEAGGGADRFLLKLQELISATPPGTMLTAGLAANYRGAATRLQTLAGLQVLARAHAPGGAGNARVGAGLFVTDAPTFLSSLGLQEEVFGPATLVVKCNSRAELLRVACELEGQLTASLHALPEDFGNHRELVDILSQKAGRLIFNGYPTGVEVAHAMTHGGPFPATSDGRSTSVGTRAIERFLRPICYQNFPDAALPAELQEGNPLQIQRLVDGKLA